MGMVVPITKNIPCQASEVICIKCMERWIAVRFYTTKLSELECEKCGKGFVIETGEIIYY